MAWCARVLDAGEGHREDEVRRSGVRRAALAGRFLGSGVDLVEGII